MSENVFHGESSFVCNEKANDDGVKEAQRLIIEKPSQKEVMEYLCQLENDYNCGKIKDLNGDPIWNMDNTVSQNGLVNLTKNQWGHGAMRIPYGEEGLEKLENILQKVDRFTGDFGPISGTILSDINQHPNAWEGGRFFITRNDDLFYDEDGSLNVNGIEIILNCDFEPYGKYLTSKYKNIVFKDAFGKVFNA